MPNHSRQVRTATLARLKAAAIANVPADRWYPQQVIASPTWPYGFTGVPIETPDRADCMNGSEVRFAVHGYARTGTISGEAQANMIGEDVTAALDGYSVTLPDGATADFTWISSTTLRDGQETSQFHVVVQMLVNVTA